MNQSPFDFCNNDYLNLCNQNAECTINKQDEADASYSCRCKTLLIGGENVVGVGDGVGERGCVFHYPANQIEDNVEMWPIAGIQIPIHIPPFLSSAATSSHGSSPSSSSSSSSTSLSSSSSSSSSASSSDSTASEEYHNQLTAATTITEEGFSTKNNASQKEMFPNRTKMRYLAPSFH